MQVSSTILERCIVIMPTFFYSNESETKFIDKLRQSLDLCKAFSFSVSFIKKPGLRSIEDFLEAENCEETCRECKYHI